MQDLLLDLFRNRGAISQKVHDLVQDLPDYQQAIQDFDTVSAQVQNILGFPLYDAYVSAFLRVCHHENSAFFKPEIR